MWFQCNFTIISTWFQFDFTWFHCDFSLISLDFNVISMWLHQYSTTIAFRLTKPISSWTIITTVYTHTTRGDQWSKIFVEEKQQFRAFFPARTHKRDCLIHLNARWKWLHSVIRHFACWFKEKDTHTQFHTYVLKSFLSSRAITNKQNKK